MKPRNIVITAAAITTLFSAGGCKSNQEQNVYGPPPADAPQSVTEEATTEVFDTDAFDPGQNINPDVYGPPSWFQTGEATEEVVEETAETAETVESTEEAGPASAGVDNAAATESESDALESVPDVSENDENDIDEIPAQLVTTEGDEPQGDEDDLPASDLSGFNPMNNEEICVYGPPEWFDDSYAPEDNAN